MRPSELVARNIRTYMRLARITQTELAQRLAATGVGMDKSDGTQPKWHRTSVSRLLAGDRRVDIDELFAVALAVETTVGALLSPDTQGGDELEFSLGAVEAPFDRDSYVTLLHTPLERVSKEELALEGWLDRYGDPTRPTWTKRQSSIRQALQAVQQPFEQDHPGVKIDDIPASKVLDYLESLREEGEESATSA